MVAAPGGRRTSPALGSGQMSSPTVSPDALAAIRKMADATLDELEYQLEAVYAEEMMVEPASLRATPDQAQGISEVGNLDPREIRSVIAADAVALRGVADRLVSGSVSSYLTPDEMSRAKAASAKAQKTWDYLQSLDLIPVSSADMDAASRHLDGHMAGLDQDVSGLEKAVVTAEAGSVPVVEPYERTSQTVTTIVVAGGIGLVILIVIGIFR
jgi:hypothetical protein